MKGIRFTGRYAEKGRFMDIDKIVEKVKKKERIGSGEALLLFKKADLLVLGGLADKIRKELHPEPVVTFVIDRNINYTNVCVSGCKFCAFYKSKNSRGAYVISKNLLAEKIRETIEFGGTQILLQGGMHPDLTIDYYIDLLEFIHDNFDIHVHGFSPPEINHMAKISGLTIEKTLRKLIRAGLDTIPGGGAEILVDRIRKRISPDKCSTDQWLKVMRAAHELGIRSTATMMFGHVESPEDIIEHLMNLRKLQDETKGFTAFIPWTFQPQNTKINVVPKTSAEYLRVLALSRIVLDNFANIQASWVTQGDKIAQVALGFGANDIGSTMIEENVVAAAGVKFRLPKNEMVRLIKDAGFKAAQRDCYYNLLRIEK